VSGREEEKEDIDNFIKYLNIPIFIFKHALPKPENFWIFLSIPISLSLPIPLASQHGYPILPAYASELGTCAITGIGRI
jgi:hypothetical protein